jgi:hypothetical protein
MKQEFQKAKAFYQNKFLGLFLMLGIKTILFFSCSSSVAENSYLIRLQDSIVLNSLRAAGIYENSLRYDIYKESVTPFKPTVLAKFKDLKYSKFNYKADESTYKSIVDTPEIPKSSELRKLYKVISEKEIESLGYVDDSTIRRSYIEISKPYYNRKKRLFFLEVTLNANDGGEFVVFGNCIDSTVRIDSIVQKRIN